jgi:hypothetical protein
VLVQSRSLDAGDPAFRAAVQAVIVGVSKLNAVAKVESPFDPENTGQISADKHSALVGLEIRGPSEDAADKIDPVVARIAEVQQAHPDLYIASFGESTGKAVQKAFFSDLKKAGLLSVPLTLIILLVAFGALVAAGIPLLLGLTAVLATLGLVAIVSQVLPMSDAVAEIVLLIGLAVGVDYTMFYLKREREERAAGRSEEAALEAAAATSGRSVLISGLTVMVAMAGMFFDLRRGVRLFRRRDHDRGRRGDARLADGAAGLALEARRRCQSWARAARPSAAPRRRRRPDLGRDHRSRAAPTCRLGGDRRRSARGAGRARNSVAHRAAEHRHVSAESLDDLQQGEDGVPGHRRRGERRREGSERGVGGRQGGDRAAQMARAQHRPDERADRRRRQ